MSELERYQPPQIAELDQWANKLYESGMFTDAKSVAQAFVKIAAGAEIGLTPFQSMTGVHFIAGKPVVGAGALASMLDHAPYNYATEWEPSIENPQACTITVFKHGVERGKARFSMEDAQRAGLIKQGGNWQKYPTDMLFARTVSQAARRYAPGATGTTFYVEAHGEMELTHERAGAGLTEVKTNGTPKPRSRVTAEVVTENVAAADVELDYDPVTTPPLSVQLKSMSLQDRADLYELVGIAKGTPLGQVREMLAAAEQEYRIDEGGEPNAAAVLACARQAKVDALPDDAAAAFQHFADTGQDLSEDPQTVIT